MAKYSKRIIASLLSESDNAANSDIKGAKLEELAKYLFDKIPSVDYYASNPLDAPGAHELDVIFSNDSRKSPLHFLDFTLIVECKNTSSRLSSHDVRWFIDKLRDRGLSTGILISLSGVTGERDGVSNAHSEVLNALNRDRIKLIIIKREDIVSLSSTDDLVKLIQAKFMSLTVLRTIS